MAKKHQYRYEVSGISDDAGIRFLDTKLRLPYRLDEKKRELVGTGEENWGKRVRITKATDIEVAVPYFRKQKEKLKGYDVYENIIGSRFVHDKERKLFIGIDKEVKDVVLHVKPIEKMPIFATLPFVHKPLYLQKLKMSDYPYAFAGTTLVGLQALMPIVDELTATNPVLATAIGTTPVLAGIIAEKVIRNKALQKDVKLFERFALKEYHKFRKWEKSHIEKRLEKVI